MPRWKCWWIWGGLILLGTVGQAEESFWPSSGGLSAGAGRRAASYSEPPQHSPSLPPILSEASASPSSTERSIAASRKEPEENPADPAGAPSAGAPKVSAESQEVASVGRSGAGSFGYDRPSEGRADGVDVGRAGPVRLGPPQSARPLSGVSSRAFDPTASTLTVLSSLAVVLGVFLLLVWALRRAMPRSTPLLPTEVVEVLGRAPLMGKQQMYLLRCGPKLLLVSVTPEGAETLTEIEHPDEVAHMTALCRQAQPGSIPGAFRQILDQMAHPKPGHRWFRRTEEPLEDSAPAGGAIQEESARV